MLTEQEAVAAGGRVCDDLGRVWEFMPSPHDETWRWGAPNWVAEDDGRATDPESWGKVNGNYGPAQIVEQR